MFDWGVGRYERTAEQLLPAARRVVELAAPEPGEDVLDIACGTGNAALVAAAAGARATGVDAAARLVEVARERALAEGREATFVVGDVGALPFPDGAFDLAVSVFGIIFAPDPGRAVGEALRVLRPGGRLVLSAWIPEGAIHQMVSVFGRAIAAATGAGDAPRFTWHDPAAVWAAAGDPGVQVRSWDEAIQFDGASPEAYLADSEEHHPMSIAGSAVLERAGTGAAARAEALAILTERNEDPGAFRVTSPYRVVELSRG